MQSESGASSCEELASVVIRDIRAEREADRMKSDFVAQANHELRTPLTSLRATAELFADGEIVSAEECAQFGQIILEHADRLANIIDNMLDIRRIESGMARAALEEVDFAQLVESCVAEQSAEALRRSTSLTVVRSVRTATAQADPTLIRQVVLNLISNALKYTPQGGVVTLEVDTDNLARAIVVSVRDNGPGIPEQSLPRLFGKFYRVESLQKVAKGTGLGLNLCRNVVEAIHGGQIGVDSQVGSGSRFWFAIPMRQAGQQAA
jgi:two-component system phosphate regulon sensor histidine kinase PhoR